MPIYYGSNKIKEIYNGSVPIKEVYNGSNKVFGSGGVIEYGEFSVSYGSLSTSYYQTFIPEFESSLTRYNVNKPLGSSKYVWGSNQSLHFDNFLSYVEKGSFQMEKYMMGTMKLNVVYQKTVEILNVKFDEYKRTPVGGGTYSDTIYIPKGFVLNNSYFLSAPVNVTSRGSNLSYVYNGDTHTLKSRYEVNLLTGEEQ